MREIGTPKIGWHVTNLHIKRPRITVNKRIDSRKRPLLDRIYMKSQIRRPHIPRAACTILFLLYFVKFRILEYSNQLLENSRTQNLHKKVRVSSTLF